MSVFVKTACKSSPFLYILIRAVVSLALTTIGYGVSCALPCPVRDRGRNLLRWECFQWFNHPVTHLRVGITSAAVVVSEANTSFWGERSYVAVDKLLPSRRVSLRLTT